MILPAAARAHHHKCAREALIYGEKAAFCPGFRPIPPGNPALARILRRLSNAEQACRMVLRVAPAMLHCVRDACHFRPEDPVPARR
jgi:hypothetical protein